MRLYPLPSLYDTSVSAVRSATPVEVSSFYLRRPYFVPWSANPTTFVFETDEPDQTHTFSVNRTSSFAIVPGTNVISLSIQLDKGANRIEVTTPTQEAYFTIAATAIETWLQSLGRELYLSVTKRLTEIQNQLATPWTTRVSSHMLPYSGIFVPARMPKIHQTRKAIVAAMGGRLGHGDGVIDVASALSYSTPWVTRPRDSEFSVPGRDYLYPGQVTHPPTGDNVGRVLDIWFLNSCLAAKQALTRLCLSLGGEDVPNPKPLSLVDIDDRQVLLRFAGNSDIEVHTLDPLSPECSDIEFDTACESATRVFLEIRSTIDVVMNSPQLPFDEIVVHPILFGFWDEGSFLDGSESSGPGLGGGDDVFDTLDPDDPFGTGFSGFSLTRRFDAPACIDTREQRGRRMMNFVYPISDSTTLTPDGVVTGTPLKVDTEGDAPAPTIGTSVVWGVSPRTFLYEGDYVRVETPDQDIQITSSHPVYPGASAVVASDPAATVSLSGTQRLVTSSMSPFFSFIHEGMGAQFVGSSVNSGSAGILAAVAGDTITVTGLSGMTLASVGRLLVLTGVDDPLNSGSFPIVTFNSATSVDIRVEAAPGNDANNGSISWSEVPAFYTSIAKQNSTTVAVLAGTVVPAGSYIMNVYRPLRDQDDLTLPGFSGRRTYQVTLSSALPKTLVDDELLDYRLGPRSIGSWSLGDTEIEVSSETVISPGDRLYLTSSVYRRVVAAVETGALHHTTGVKVWAVELDSGLPSGLVDNQTLYSVRADPCWQNGSPMTPLMVLHLAPTSYIVP